MKKYISPSFFMVVGLGLITWGLVNNKPLEKEIIKQTTDSRGLISVQFREGKDTLAFDDMSMEEYKKEFE